MPRPPLCRSIAQAPKAMYFKPRGAPLSQLEEVVLTVDELEALRLADLEGLYQEQAAERMKVSRQTFGRIIASARRKSAEALVEGKALRIEGGHFEMAAARQFVCAGCGHAWGEPFGTGRPGRCPRCRSGRISRVDAGFRRRSGGGSPGSGPPPR